MALISRAQAKPGFASATQTPFAIGPGGGAGFGDLLSRQFALREQMAQAQLAQMQQDLLFQKQNQTRRGEIYGKSRMTQGVLSAGPGADPSSAKAYDFARSIPGVGGIQPTNAGFLMTRAIGVPAAHQGMMQSGQIMGQLGAAVAQANRPMYGMRRTAQGNSLEKGGRVPKTGTYKLHKGEVVVPRKASDVMFPYVGGGPPKSKGKALKSYRQGTIELPKGVTKKEAQTAVNYLKDRYGVGSFAPTTTLPVAPVAIPETAARSFMMGGDEERATQGMEALGNLAGAALLPGTQPRTEEENAAIMEQARQVEQANAAALAQSNEALAPPPQPPTAFEPGLQASESAGTISYAGPGVGGMTKFGVEGTTGPFDTMQVAQGSDIVDMHRMENEALIADRSAQIAEQRGDKLERYLNEQSTPNRELVAMIKENDRAAQRWRKRSTELRGQADKLRSIDVAKQLQTIESAGVEGAAYWKAKGEAGKDQLANFDANYEALGTRVRAAFKNYKEDSNEERFRVDIMMAFAPFLSTLVINNPDGKPMNDQQKSAWFDEFTMGLVTGDPGARADLTGLMQDLANGRLGGPS